MRYIFETTFIILDMKLKKVFPLILHIIICVIILALPLLVMQLDHESLNINFYYSYLIRTSFLLLIFYINYLYLINRFLFKKHFFEYIFFNILLVIGVVLLQDVLVDLMQFHEAPNHVQELRGPNQPIEKKPHRPPMFFRLIGDYSFPLFFIGLSVAFRVTKRWYSDSLNFESLKAANLEADLKQLKEQLNPHFLFNTLNNIYYLIGTNTTKAQESVHRLSGLLRYALYDNEVKLVPLDKEIDFTRDFIELMSLRLPKEFNLSVYIQDETQHIQIAPMLFVSLIENAFKHGVTNFKTDFISIKIIANDNNGVLCIVSNSYQTGANSPKDPHSGIGLKNLRQRLELMYPDRYKLDIKENNNIFEVILSINIPKEKTENDAYIHNRD